MPTAAQPYVKTSHNIAIERLFYSYKGLEVFRDFTLITNSKTVVLRGPSGCGKTTLLKLLSGNLLPDKVISMPATNNSCLCFRKIACSPG